MRITVRTGISHTDALERIEGCVSEYELRILLHRDEILSFSTKQEEEISDAVNAQRALIQAKRILISN